MSLIYINDWLFISVELITIHSDRDRHPLKQDIAAPIHLEVGTYKSIAHPLVGAKHRIKAIPTAHPMSVQPNQVKSVATSPKTDANDRSTATVAFHGHEPPQTSFVL